MNPYIDIKTHLEMMLDDEMKFFAGIRADDEPPTQVFRLIQALRKSMDGVNMKDLSQPKIIKIENLRPGMLFMGQYGFSTVKEVKELPVIADNKTYLVNTMNGKRGQYFNADDSVTIYTRYEGVVKK